MHGSVLVDQGVVYVAAGRSTYLDGGVYLYGLDPETGKVLHHNVLAGPFPEGADQRDVSFYVLGANADVLVSEGDYLYMRQKKLTRSLQEVPVEVLSSKGEQDVGLHVFSTAGLLDGSWYNRTFWMYSKRWPGFQLANQAPKAGQLLVVDDQHTYALRVFYHRNVHSPMFFPEREGYLLFADNNTTEPQIVGRRRCQDARALAAAIRLLPRTRRPDTRAGKRSFWVGQDDWLYTGRATRLGSVVASSGAWHGQGRRLLVRGRGARSIGSRGPDGSL